MQMVRMPVGAGADLDGFRAAARQLIAGAMPPDAVEWNTGAELDLFGEAIGARRHRPPLSLAARGRRADRAGRLPLPIRSASPCSTA